MRRGLFRPGPAVSAPGAERQTRAQGADGGLRILKEKKQGVAR